MSRIRILSVMTMLVMGGFMQLSAQYNSINLDYQTAAIMVGEYNAAAAAELYYDEQVKDVLEKYGVAEVAAAGIYTSKHLDRKALTDLGMWSSATENHYYRRIYNLVSAKIIPEMWDLSSVLIRYPHKAIYWGSYLYKTCTEIKSLCLQFESIVTNGKLSFSDINFLELNPQVASIVQLSKIGQTDWKSLLQSMTYVYDNYSRKDMNSEVDNMYSLGSSFASSGYSGFMEKMIGSSKFSGTFVEKAKAAYEMADKAYKTYKDADGKMSNVLKSYWGENPTAADLFSFASYSVSSWVSNYVEGSANTCYTQRYYIACIDQGSETLCQYEPPTGKDDVINGKEWTRFSTSDASFYPASDQLESVLSNSEKYAGWTRALVNTMNGKDPEVTYKFRSYLSSYSIKKGDKQTKKAYAYSITVTKSWYRKTEVYEEVFDSYSMNLPTFLNKMNGYLDEYNENEEGKVYKLLSDEKKYYQVSTTAKVKGCESAIIMLTCTEDVNLGKGTTQYKCRKCGGSLNEHSKECTTKTTLSSSDTEDVDISALYEREDSLKTELNDASRRLEDLEDKLEGLNQTLSGISDKNSESYRQLSNQKELAENDISKLKAEISSLQNQIDEVGKAISESKSDDVKTDDYYRIPAIMQDLKTTFNLTWQGEGWWNGYTYHRYATCPTVNGTITFSASLSIARKPKYFLGIKIHRAIMKISWALTATYTDTQIVDNITLDPDMDDMVKTAKINARLSELAREYPKCTTSVEYIKADDGEVEDDSEDPHHLLWSSDRLAIARQVEARLMNIYADIVSMKKMMHYRLTILDALGGALPYINDEQGKKQTMAQKCRHRWLKNAADKHHSMTYNGKYDYEDGSE